MVKKIIPAKKTKRTHQDIDIDSECCLAHIKDINTFKDRMTDKQEHFLSNEKTEEEIEYLRTLHANDPELSSMDN